MHPSLIRLALVTATIFGIVAVIGWPSLVFIAGFGTCAFFYRRHHVTTYLTVVPAYGRDYQTRREALNAWDSGLDFIIASYGPDDGRYISKRDVVANPNLQIKIRYKGLTQIAGVPR